MARVWQNLFNPTAVGQGEPWSWPKRLAAGYLGVVLVALVFGFSLAERSNGLSFAYLILVTLPWSVLFSAVLGSIDFPLLGYIATFIAPGPLNAYLIYKILETLRVKRDR